MSTQSLTEAKTALIEDVTNQLNSIERGSLRDDVERIIKLAGRLFEAIERQAHELEEELVITCGEQVRPYAQKVFKERLGRCAEALDSSIHEIGLNLDRRAIERRAT